MSRIGRFLDPDGRLRLGRFDGDPVDRAQPLRGDLFGRHEPVGDSYPLADVTLLTPVAPSKIIGVGSNYRAHAAEMGRALPSVPKLFLMPSTAALAPGLAIERPPLTERMDHEAELGVVVGRTMQRVSEADAMAYVLGYTCVNDVTARDFQHSDKVFARAKGFDTFCPLGPWIRTDLDPTDLRVRGWVNDALRQDGRTSDMVFNIPQLLSFISHVMTLLPGDVIATGTPAGVGPLVAGDRVSVHVEGVGRLDNVVVDRVDR